MKVIDIDAVALEVACSGQSVRHPHVDRWIEWQGFLRTVQWLDWLVRKEGTSGMRDSLLIRRYSIKRTRFYRKRVIGSDWGKETSEGTVPGTRELPE